MLGATADTNIYISALNFGGSPDEVLNLARAGEIKLHISDDILNEIARVLREKFRWSEDAISLARRRIGDFTQHVTPATPVEAVRADPTDNRILECAVAAGSNYVVTGDKHLLRLGEFDGIKIVRPVDFLIQQSRGR